MSNPKAQTLEIPVPVVRPLGVEVTAADVKDVWDVYIAPSQTEDAAPQSAETRTLMAILRAVHAGLDRRTS